MEEKRKPTSPRRRIKTDIFDLRANSREIGLGEENNPQEEEKEGERQRRCDELDFCSSYTLLFSFLAVFGLVFDYFTLYSWLSLEKEEPQLDSRLRKRSSFV